MEYNDLIREMAGAMDPASFIQAVKAECFEAGAASDAQLLMLLAIAKDRGLNPLAKEIFAFVNKKTGRMSVGTGIDGWIRIAQRQPTFRGYRAEEIRDEAGNLLAIKMQMFRSDWEHPGEYTAYLKEWAQATDNWRQMPTHRLFDKAWHECCRFTFAVTGIVDREDMDRIREADAKGESGDVIHQPGPEQPRAIEHQPVEPANFVRSDQPQAVPVNERPHLRVQVELPGEAPPAPSTPEAQSPAPGRRGRPPGAKNKPKESNPIEVIEANERQADESESAPPAPPDDAKESAAAQMAPNTSAAQRAAGLEHVDPTEHPLETFLRVHDVPERRVAMAFSKYGAMKLADLTDEQKAAILGVFEKSYKLTQAGA